MKQDKQPRRASKNVPLAQLHPRSDMNTLAKGGDKESNEPLRRPLKGGEQPQSRSSKRKR